MTPLEAIKIALPSAAPDGWRSCASRRDPKHNLNMPPPIEEHWFQNKANPEIVIGFIVFPGVALGLPDGVICVELLAVRGQGKHLSAHHRATITDRFCERFYEPPDFRRQKAGFYVHRWAYAPSAALPENIFVPEMASVSVPVEPSETE